MDGKFLIVLIVFDKTWIIYKYYYKYLYSYFVT